MGGRQTRRRVRVCTEGGGGGERPRDLVVAAVLPGEVRRPKGVFDLTL